jgi:hypothetical protein
MSAQLRQQTLSFTGRGQVQANKPGPRPKGPTTMSAAVATALISGSKRRRQVGGVNEAKAIEAFWSSRAHFDAGEPDSKWKLWIGGGWSAKAIKEETLNCVFKGEEATGHYLSYVNRYT